MIRIGLVATVLVASTPSAACPNQAVTLTGDDDLVAMIHDLLSARGIDIAGRCGVRAHVTRRGGAITISIGELERTVNEPTTAATVIESFTRDDIAASLLVRREVPVEPEPAPARTDPVRSSHARGVQIFGAAETSIGSDHTTWMGAQIGACVMLGPVCAAARFRVAALVGGDGVWDGGSLDRHSNELLLGIDVPFALPKGTLSFGFAAGLGAMRTRDEATGEDGGTGGLRADVHTTLSIPVRRNLALDFSASLDLTQETHVESEMRLPPEPTALLRFGIGVRYGGL